MEKETVIVTGGGGYIGRCTAEVLHREGFVPIIVDNFSNSKKPKDCPFPIHEVDLADRELTLRTWKTLGPALAVIHFAARALVSESCQRPEFYFRNNVMSTLNVSEASLEIGVRCLVHSSSCAVYGKPRQMPIPETHPLGPITPYGETKWLGERILHQLAQYRGLRAINLRYFNPAGAIDEGRLGEAHEPETHLIPNVVRGFLENTAIPLYGDDYDTPDGTCVRDFIHVEDLALAHIAALKYVTEENTAPRVESLNVGGGKGNSVKEVIEAAERVFGRKGKIQLLPRREGDPPRLVADTKLCAATLRWSPKRTLDDMIRSHAQWERARQKL